MTIKRTWIAGAAAAVALSGLLAAPPTVAVAQAPDRAAVEQGFLEEVLPALETPIGWTGSVAACDAGAPSSAAQSATSTTINYVRRLAGLDPVSLDPALSASAQEAALIMEANDDLSHDPPSSWTCWSEEGARAAGSSNLALGNSGAAAILAYMQDDGAGNEVVGHRRWILRPDAATMGSGSTSGANALWVFGADAVGAATPDWVPWPTGGYFPSPLEPAGRWSLSASDPAVTFAGARVAVVAPDGTSLPVRAYPPREGFASNTLVWEVTSVEVPTGAAPATYTVTVSDIGRSDGPPLTFEYGVSFVSPPLTPAAPVSLSGTAKVGRTLTADAGEWKPEADAYSYRWYRSGILVPGAGEERFRVTPADLGEALAVEVTAGAAGYRDSVQRSEATEPVAEGDPLEAVAAPRIRGRARVGSTLRVDAGDWDPDAETYSFTWFRDGAEVAGAGGSSYRLTRRDKGKRITVVVTAARFGYGDGAETTPPTRRVARRR